MCRNIYDVHWCVDKKKVIPNISSHGGKCEMHEYTYWKRGEIYATKEEWSTPRMSGKLELINGLIHSYWSHCFPRRFSLVARFWTCQLRLKCCRVTDRVIAEVEYEGGGSLFFERSHGFLHVFCRILPHHTAHSASFLVHRSYTKLITYYNVIIRKL